MSELLALGYDWQFNTYIALNENEIAKSYESTKHMLNITDTAINRLTDLLNIWTARLKEIDYLPPKLSKKLIPKIIELMESGMAENY